MTEYKDLKMKYTENDIKEGTKLRCTKTIPEWWQLGKVYTVSLNDGILQITDDNGDGAYTDFMLDCLNGNYTTLSFEIVEEEKEMTKYVEVTHLMDFTPDKELLTVGNKYEVVEENLDGVSIKVNESTPNYFVYNNQIKRVEEKEMKYTEKDLYEGMELLCIDNGGWSLWETGEIYTVTKSNLSGKLIIEGDDEVGRTFRDTEAILGYLNGERGTRLSTIEDQKEEEKEMKKYAKITKYAGLSGTDKENGLEIGKEYEIVKFSSVLEDCYIYLNEEHPSYFISETQYELVEKEKAPTLKANVKVDVKEVIQAKIDALTIEAERLFTKRDRLEQHAINLNAKARKLEEVLETIKEFE